jgi:hypothetical protein
VEGNFLQPPAGAIALRAAWCGLYTFPGLKSETWATLQSCALGREIWLKRGLKKLKKVVGKRKKVVQKSKKVVQKVE